ncbi:histidine kinase [Aquimarina atlantica]|uniref:Histidine kinase n=1 Tax=Aquimarina atlantica TaxID=1317122 RepID=A0A023C057_9FLAO|nr:histidine kinase [Aquimarina atlantica]EZH75717.1 histidine kinase [Aquimarina atlantica]
MKHFIKGWKNKEWIYQIVFFIILFIVYSFDKHDPEIEFYKIAFFIHYVFVSLFISYVLVPFFFYKKKYLKLAVSLILVFMFVYFIEEFVLEKIFFPGRRGQHISSIFYTLIDIMPIIIIMISFKLGWDANKKQKEVEQLHMSVQESELRFLKSQINPHFLFNNLNNLYSYAIENSPKTPSIILELSSVLRYMLYDCKEDLVSLEKEIKHLENFVKLNELQIEERGNVNFEIPGITKNYQIAPLILVVFIENAFKHSNASQSDNIVIDIKIDIEENDKLTFICENNFLPNANNQNIAKGIGLKNVRKRLNLLYPEKHYLVIEEENNRYKVLLSLYLNT